MIMVARGISLNPIADIQRHPAQGEVVVVAAYAECHSCRYANQATAWSGTKAHMLGAMKATLFGTEPPDQLVFLTAIPAEAMTRIGISFKALENQRPDDFQKQPAGSSIHETSRKLLAIRMESNAQPEPEANQCDLPRARIKFVTLTSPPCETRCF